MFSIVKRFLLIFSRTGNLAPITNVRIEYRNVLINKHNVDVFRHGTITLGRAHVYKSYITVYRYIISANLDLKPDDVIYKKLSHADEAQIIAHETKHFMNFKYGYELPWGANNYYEISMLCAIEEMTAYASELLCQHTPRNRKEMFDAILFGISALMRRPDYISEIMDTVTEYCEYNRQDNDFRKNVEKWIACKNIHYSYQFHKIANIYLTFGNYRFLDIFHPVPSELNKKFKELKNIYETATREHLREYLRQ